MSYGANIQPGIPEADDAPIASLASRISGLSTSNTPHPPSSSDSQPQSPPVRPKPNTSNNLFGKALAGVKSDRASAPSPSTSTATSTPAPAPVAATAAAPAEESKKNVELLPAKEEGKDKMTNLMDEQDGWGEPAQNGNGEKKEVVDTSMSEASGLISNEFQVEVKLADLQADPNSPLYSVQTFEQLNLHEDLMKGIYAVGFKKPSKIQEVALPLLLSNPPRNLIGQSQSGTGKTAAFSLNMLSRVDPAMMTPQAICLAPSRELARQIQEVIDKIGQFTDIKTFLAVPGSWSRNVRIDKHILIGTPGTLVDMLSRGGRIFDPKQIRVFVLDEADEMIALQGLGDQTTRIKRMLPPNVQNVLFSATFNDQVRSFAETFAPEANQLFLKLENVTVDAIKQLYMECNGEEGKFDALSALYDCMSIGQSIVFCKRKKTADDIAERLTSEGHSVASLHGDKQSRERDDILDGFRNGKTKVLITTNVVARGIDIQQVNMVVNYDVPDQGPEGNFEPDIETYIHRIGRTGRFGRKGCSVIFVHDGRSKSDVDYIMNTLGKPMKRIDAMNPADLEQLEKALKIAMKGPN
ncbi:ATP-dependent RNA helicase DBP5 [Kwoniella shandongensis]|uniref:RNA helicase n=1 Tax=Kwoniella shandongensis TaxID=1734106 RepID=A0AAJ8LJL4_9TREE